MAGLPIIGAIRPSVLAGTFNGRLPSSLLLPIDGRGGKGLPDMGRCWRAMRARLADATGIDLWYTGVYRSYDQQVALLKSRAEPFNPGIGNYKWVRHWNGQTWYGNGAQVATPGTSNHGWGMAVDMALRKPGSTVPQPISQAALAWLIPHADEYGFSWEAQSEPWHVRMVTGDDIPLAVLAYEQDKPIPPKPPEPPTWEDDEMSKLYLSGKDYYERQNGMWVHVQDGNYVAWYLENKATLGEPVKVDPKFVTAANTVEARQIAFPPVTPPTNIDNLPTNAEMQAALGALSQQIGQLPEPVAAAVTAAIAAALEGVDWGSLVKFPTYVPEAPA